MKYWHICAATFALALATPAQANPHVDRVLGKLQSEGFEKIETERTWLGRVRIAAEKGNVDREIILNRTTGEILRDYSEIDEEGLLEDEEAEEGEQGALLDDAEEDMDDEGDDDDGDNDDDGDDDDEEDDDEDDDDDDDD